MTRYTGNIAKITTKTGSHGDFDGVSIIVNQDKTDNIVWANFTSVRGKYNVGDFVEFNITNYTYKGQKYNKAFKVKLLQAKLPEDELAV